MLITFVFLVEEIISFQILIHSSFISFFVPLKLLSNENDVSLRSDSRLKFNKIRVGL